MLDELVENRYPYDHALDFFLGGHWSILQGLHISIAWAFVAVASGFVLCQFGMKFSARCATLYFALAVFNNPAFELAGIKLNEYFGMLAMASTFVEFYFFKTPFDFRSPVVWGLMLTFSLAVTHGILMGIAYPEINPDVATWLVRAAVNFKILVLAVNLWIVGLAARKTRYFDFLIKSVVACGTTGTLIYLLQILITLTGTLPYGTYIDAGFVGIPSYGSVSIERGHFGKMMAPLAPFFLFAWHRYGWGVAFALFCLTALINISASSLSFFAIFALMAILTFRKEAFVLKKMIWASPLLIFLLLGTIEYHDVFYGVIDKIYDLAISGDEEAIGGRSSGVFLEYLSKYPLGLGYGGSTLRTGPDLPEINSGFFAFITQFSIFAIPIVIGYVMLAYLTVASGHWSGPDLLTRRCLALGVPLSAFIFFADILWFVPTIWLSFELLWSRKSMYESRETPAIDTAHMPAS